MNKLERVLKHEEVTQIELARACNIHPNTISNIIHKNTMPSVDKAITICDYLGYSVYEVFGNEELSFEKYKQKGEK